MRFRVAGGSAFEGLGRPASPGAEAGRPVPNAPSVFAALCSRERRGIVGKASLEAADKGALRAVPSGSSSVFPCGLLLMSEFRPRRGAAGCWACGSLWPGGGPLLSFQRPRWPAVPSQLLVEVFAPPFVLSKLKAAEVGHLDFFTLHRSQRPLTLNENCWLVSVWWLEVEA